MSAPRRPRPPQQAVRKPSSPLDLDVLQKEARFAPFEFILDGEQHELPHMETLDGEQIMRLEQGGGRDIVIGIAGEELGARLMALPAFALNAVLEAWLDHAGTSLGE